MAYFLKQSRIKGRTYLAIYESFYSHEKKGTAHRSYKSLGSIESLIQSGMEDPVAYFKKEVDAMNKERDAAGVRKISDYLGYFPLRR
ncbi:MAG TPA: hypothetical protein DDW87_03420 [Firmicutes bacterium]|nr:hypothetical protein [Bacillota bacterium]